MCLEANDGESEHHATKTYWGGYVTAPLMLNLGTNIYVNGQLQNPTVNRGRSPNTHWIQTKLGPTDDMKDVHKGQMSAPATNRVPD